MTAEIIDLRPIFADANSHHDLETMSRLVADRAFIAALALLDSAYGRDYRRKRLQQTIYAMDHADENCRSTASSD